MSKFDCRSAAASLLTLALVAFLWGCASLDPRNPVPETLVTEAQVPGMERARWWGDEAPADLAAEIRRTIPSVTKLAESPREKGRPVVNYLALSSGGDDGAFAAGVLVGWTRSGKRPRFEFVTGVSAGALIAPFAFLGPGYDKYLESIWTGHAGADLITPQPLAVLFGGNALADSQPLAQLIAQYVDRRLLQAIAREYRGGRFLLVATTNLDAQRPVVWNMGEIALHPGPEAVTLFRQVLLASISIPVAFPPVRIQVAAGGKVRDELHVDGGTTRKLFIAPLQLSLRALEPFYSAPPQNRFYIIANTKLAPEWKLAETDLLSIAQSSLAAINKSHAAGDLFRLYLLATREGADFNLAVIPSNFSVRPNRPFEPEYMAALFEAGLKHAGSRWLKRPPELEQQ